ncbi:hypothetical protein ACEQPO_24180 [Bacillus sp. SL00103]
MLKAYDFLDEGKTCWGDRRGLWRFMTNWIVGQTDRFARPSHSGPFQTGLAFMASVISVITSKVADRRRYL